MLYKETISLILHNIQANKKSALTLKEPTPINPRITALKPLSLTSQAFSAPPKTSYNRSRKRNITEIANNKNKTINDLNKKVNLKVTIASLSKKIARNQHAKETYRSNQKKAIKLLKKEYKTQLKIGAFLKAILLFKDKGNAVTFLTLNNAEYKDL
jgi:methylthioribose-1-phosphate isomerase